MLRLGWQTFWRHVGDVVAPERLRRAVVVAVLATVLAAAGLTALEVATHWAGSVVVVALFTVAVGLAAFACCPLSRPVEPRATINGRQVRADTARTVRWSVQPYLGRRPPMMDQDDREAVLTDTALLRRGVTLDIVRGTTALAAGFLAGTAGAVMGATHLWPVLLVVYAANLPGALLKLGRAERARRTAESLAPLP